MVFDMIITFVHLIKLGVSTSLSVNILQIVTALEELGIFTL